MNANQPGRLAKKLVLGISMLFAIATSFSTLAHDDEHKPGFHSHGYGTPFKQHQDTDGKGDSDQDGVINENDRCPGTDPELDVDNIGCPMILDNDGDGVRDYHDTCDKTRPGARVDEHGCEIKVDSDLDGVPNNRDKCPNTPPGMLVDPEGCAVHSVKDSDGDGVIDSLDQCAGTPRGTQVDAKGCTVRVTLDRDRDGVMDDRDACPNTVPGRKVDSRGCALKAVATFTDVLFATDSATLRPEATNDLNNAARIINSLGSVRIVVEGHTDATGSEAYNQQLSQRRADSVKRYLVQRGVSASRLATRGFGESRPQATNTTKEGRRQNRRVELRLAR